MLFFDHYKRGAAWFLKQRPATRAIYLKTLQLLEMANSAHRSPLTAHRSPLTAHRSPILHALGGKLKSLHSVLFHVWQHITLQLSIQDHQIIPVNLGDNDRVY